MKPQHPEPDVLEKLSSAIAATCCAWSHGRRHPRVTSTSRIACSRAACC